MVVRLQGFDRGLFGGNFHTHNELHIPPGLDAVCYSNGRDYVRGWRYCVAQAAAGRVVMSVDCTALLNRRHYEHGVERRSWMTAYPNDPGDTLSFDEVTVYGDEPAEGGDAAAPRLAIVSYGNGVVTALEAAAQLREQGGSGSAEVAVIDSPYLSAVPQQLREVVGSFDAVLFADVCKDGPGAPLLSHACTLHNEGRLPAAWGTVAAPRAYNPLGSTITFLNVEDVVGAATRLCKRLAE